MGICALNGVPDSQKFSSDTPSLKVFNLPSASGCVKWGTIAIRCREVDAAPCIPVYGSITIELRWGAVENVRGTWIILVSTHDHSQKKSLTRFHCEFEASCNLPT